MATGLSNFNILISRLRFLGDVVLTTPLISALRTAYPDAHITYLAETPYQEILYHHPDLDNIVGLDRSRISDQLRIMHYLISRQFDIAIDLFGNPRSALLTWLTGAEIRIGGDFRGRKYAYTHRIPGPRGADPTAMEFHLRYLAPLDLAPFPPTRPKIRIAPKEAAWARDYLNKAGYQSGNTLVGIHPGATWPAKRWFPDRFAQLVRKLTQRPGTQIILTMGPGEQKMVESIIQQSDSPVLTPTLLNLRQLAAVLSLLDVYVSNDCGPMHIAPAVDTPTVGIFGPGEPHIWFPYSHSRGHRLVYHELDCSHCHRDHCEKMDCMAAISVQDVYDVVLDALSQEVRDE
jgi:predicted lipopolysaccharide heptosyltransferase III